MTTSGRWVAASIAALVPHTGSGTVRAHDGVGRLAKRPRALVAREEQPVRVLFLDEVVHVADGHDLDHRERGS